MAWRAAIANEERGRRLLAGAAENWDGQIALSIDPAVLEPDQGQKEEQGQRSDHPADAVRAQAPQLPAQHAAKWAIAGRKGLSFYR